jgi:DNA-binding IclR family transcriptional regulator
MSKIVDRTLDLLGLFAEERRPLSLSDIARLLHIPVSSCHDVLRALHARGYIYELAPRAGYYPTLRLQSLGKVISDNDPVTTRAEPLLRSLRDTLDESVMLSKVDGLQATYLMVVDATHPLRYAAKVGDHVRTIYATSGGKALLASLDDSALDAFLKTVALRPMTKRTHSSKAALREEIVLGRRRGWFLNRGESLAGVTTISASFIWNGSVYIITIAGPSARLDRGAERAARLLRGVCALLEKGYAVIEPRMPSVPVARRTRAPRRRGAKGSPAAKVS